MTWALQARIAVANDAVTAGYVSDPGSETYGAIGDVVAPIVTIALASNPTIVTAATGAATAAAGTAVNQKIIDNALLGNAYIRSIPGHSFVVTDDKGNASTLDIDDTGLLTDSAISLLAQKQGVAFLPLDPVSGWKTAWTDTDRHIGMGIRADNTFWAPGAVYAGANEPPPPPTGMFGVWFKPASDGTFTIYTQFGA